MKLVGVSKAKNFRHKNTLKINNEKTILFVSLLFLKISLGQENPPKVGLVL